MKSNQALSELGHEWLGHWFIQHHGTPESLPRYRLVLAGLNVPPMPEDATAEEGWYWLQQVRVESPVYRELPATTQIGLLNVLLGRLSAFPGNDFAIALARAA
ncbi:MAG: hypothetical protein R3F37_03510 [Candidatus Competibacteraceae bacterium]